MIIAKNCTFWLLLPIFALSCDAAPAAAATPPVSIEIAVSRQKSHVIGDTIELNWKFTNHSTTNLAFMWEGCCRINGRVDMKRQGPPVIPKSGIRPRHSGFGPGIYNPACLHCRIERQKEAMSVDKAPMGPATAHMFAKPVRLRAGSTEEISSRLANWVLLEDSGDYLLTGNYLGVHPKQRPQMPRGAALWTEIATSKPISLTLLSPDDYLAEGAARARVRGVGLQLRRPTGLKPFTDLGFRVILTNHTATNISIPWPGEAAFWLIDQKGVRVPDSRYVITDYGDPVTIPAHDIATVPLPVASDIFAGKPFGTYRAFVELKETDAQLRTPSNPVSIEWQLTAPTVTQLLLQAGDKPAVGSRNPPLKLLRQHLPDLRETLAGLDTAGLGPKSLALAGELREAAELSKLHPKPGSVAIHVAIDAAGNARFQDPAVARAFGTRYSENRERFARIHHLRRHLGWSLSLTLRVAAEARLAAIAGVLNELRDELSTLTARPQAKAFNRTATAFSEISFAAPDAPINAADIRSSSALSARLRSATGSPRLVMPPTMSWRELISAAAPLIDQGRAFEVLIRP